MTLRTQPPAESDLLCEFCGYILNGLEARQGNCPECGTAVAGSIEPGHRSESPVETEWSRRSFWTTTRLVLLHKRRFFRETRTRADHPNVARFGRVHRRISGILFGVAGALHTAWMAETRGLLTHWTFPAVAAFVGVAIGLAIGAMVLLTQVTRLAAWLTTKEGAFWGMRLPTPVVTRALNFHAANYLPVAVLAVLLTGGYRVALALQWTDATSGVIYLVCLCVLVVVSALWLFESYVIAMRRIRLANF